MHDQLAAWLKALASVGAITAFEWDERRQIPTSFRFNANGVGAITALTLTPDTRLMFKHVARLKFRHDVDSEHAFNIPLYNGGAPRHPAAIVSEIISYWRTPAVPV